MDNQKLGARPRINCKINVYFFQHYLISSVYVQLFNFSKYIIKLHQRKLYKFPKKKTKQTNKQKQKQKT